MAQGDIPAVQEEIGRVKSPLLAHYQRTSRAGFREVIEELEEAEEEGFGREEAALAVLALLLLLRRQLKRPVPDRTRRAFKASARRLILAGVASAGGAGARLKARGPTIDRQASRAANELVQLSAARLEANKTAQRLDALLFEFQESEKARRQVRERQAEDADRKERGLKKERIPRRRDGSPGSPDRTAWKAQLDSLLADRNGAITDVIADAWAYRAFNVGVFLAAKAGRIEELVAVNPKDRRTTVFCNWVHGKVISIRRIERQIDAYTSAIKDDDKAAAKRAWPFIDQSAGGLKKARDRLRAGRTGTTQGSRANRRRAHRNVSNQEVFRRFFVRVGLPPYHFRCRTRAVPRIVFGAIG